MATNNDPHQLINRNNRNENGEPVCKRTKFNGSDACIDLKTLISYSSEINTEQPTKSSNSNLSAQNEDAGDSGFQEFASNDSPSSSCSKDLTNGSADNEQSSSNNINKQHTTFSSSTSSLETHQFASIHQTNTSNDLNGIQLQDLNEDNEDSESIISDISCLSSLSDLEDAEKWQLNFGPFSWQPQLTSGSNPRQIIDDLLPNNVIPTNKVDNLTLWRYIFSILREPKRKKLPHVNNIEDVVSLIQRSKKIVVLTGAGVSTSCGIPDFRSRNGVYARLSVDFPDLPDPQAMFCINYFKKDQRPFFKFPKEIYPGQFKPSISHKFIKLIESNGKLLRNYTQNIDTLEKSANIENVITCHGSFSTASCTNCKYQVDGSFIKDDIFNQKIPICPRCSEEDSETLCVLKPDIVFFGESLPDEFHDSIAKDKEECDLLIVIGSSLKVRPVASIPTSIPADVPQILINRENLSHMTFDVELLGDCDIIVQELCNRLGEGWNSICVNDKLNEMKDFNFDELIKSNEQQSNAIATDDNSVETNRPTLADLIPEDSFVCLPPSRYLFKGAECYSDDDDDDDDSSEEDESNESNKLNCSDQQSSSNSLNNSTNLDHFNNLPNDLNQINNQSSTTKPDQVNHLSSIDTNNNS